MIFLDVAWGAAYRGGSARDGFGKDVEGDQAAVEYQPEGGTCFLLWPARLEDLSEDIGEDSKHDQRVEKYPSDAEHGAAVAEQDIALDELSKQVAMGMKRAYYLHLSFAGFRVCVAICGTTY